MKKRSKLLLIVPACMMFLTGCDAKITIRNIKYVLKETAKKILHAADDFFKEEEKPAETEVKVVYHF